MGQAEQQKKGLTIEDWITLEQTEGIRYEYHFGEVFAMAGGTFNHGTVTDNAFFETETHNRAGGRKCRTLSSEFKTEVDAKGRYVYPDTTVVCGDIKKSDKVKGAVTNPALVIEVVSESSGSYDRGKKYKYYRRLPSVKEYLILEQDFVSATLYRRNGNGDLFTRHEFDSLESVVELQSIKLNIELSRLYLGVEFTD